MEKMLKELVQANTEVTSKKAMDEYRKQNPLKSSKEILINTEKVNVPKFVNGGKLAINNFKSEKVPTYAMQTSISAMDTLIKPTLVSLKEKYDMSKQCVADVMGEIPELKVYVDIPQFPNLEKYFRQK